MTSIAATAPSLALLTSYTRTIAEYSGLAPLIRLTTRHRWWLYYEAKNLAVLPLVMGFAFGCGHFLGQRWLSVELAQGVLEPMRRMIVPVLSWVMMRGGMMIASDATCN